MQSNINYPDAIDPSKVGTYSAVACVGGGYVWDAVLEYRVWSHPELGAPDEFDGSDYYCAFGTYREALAFSEECEGAEKPMALILQEEFIDEAAEGQYSHVKAQRITEWAVIFLRRPKRTQETIPAFLSPSAPANRLDIIRGLATAPNKY